MAASAKNRQRISIGIGGAGIISDNMAAPASSKAAAAAYHLLAWRSKAPTGSVTLVTSMAAMAASAAAWRHGGSEKYWLTSAWA
jgi:hypothetical protein